MQHQLDEYLKTNYDAVFHGVQDHIEKVHTAIPGTEAYTHLVTDHLAALVRSASGKTPEDIQLSEILDITSVE